MDTKPSNPKELIMPLVKNEKGELGVQAPRRSIFVPHQERVIKEHRELTLKLADLQWFFFTPIFAALPEAERVRLRSQARFMRGYEQVLLERINAFIAAS